MPEGNSKQFGMAAVKQFSVTSVMLFVQIIVFFVSAGHVSDLRPWLFFSIAFVNYFVSITIQYKLNPQLLVQRLKWKRKGSKLWDEILMRVSNLIVIILIPVIAGLDVGRFRWSNIDIYFAALGLPFILISTYLINSAMVVNPHFEPTVRVQKDRGHKVIKSGPYKVVRHPGYLGGILFAFSIPLMIGSILAFIPVGIYVFLMVLRAWLEDNTLQEELDGYSEYTKQTKYRLFPEIW